MINYCMENILFVKLLLAVVFGAVIGLESEVRLKEKSNDPTKSEKSTIGGVRTYTILSLFGGIAGLMFTQGETFLVYASFLALAGLMIAAYIENIKLRQAFGITTEIAVLITFMLGFLTTSELVSLEIILFILVILAFFLSQKRGVSALLEKVTHSEIIDIFRFGVVAVVILPLLPNETFYLGDIISSIGIENTLSESLSSLAIINPFRVWLIVVIISGINLGSYLVSKLIGSDKGLLLTSVIGGFISSTSTTVALSIKSKKASINTARTLAGAALISNAVSLIGISILLSVISPQIMGKVTLPLLSMFLIGIVVGGYFLFRSKSKNDQIEIKYEPFSIGPALKFVSVVVLLTILIQVFQIIGAESLIIIVTAISGVVGLDAPTIALSELANTGEIALSVAAVVFLATNAVNFFTKVVIAYLNGHKEFFRVILIGILITLLGTITFLFV